MTSEITCPGCGKVNDAHTGIGNLGSPKLGDVSICLYCSMLNVFTTKDGHLTLRSATRDEARMYLLDPQVRRAVAATRQVRRGW